MPSESNARPRKRAARIILIASLAVLAVIVAAAATWVAMFWPVRSEITQVSPGETTSTTPTPSQAGTTTIEAEGQTVASALGSSDAPGMRDVASVDVTTVLRRPVIVVATGIEPEDAAAADSLVAELRGLADAVTTPEGTPCTYFLQVRSSAGDVVGTVKRTDGRWQLDAPRAPANVDELTSWIAAVYGTGAGTPEPWTRRILGTSLAGNELVVRTDLDPGSANDLASAQTIIDAVNSSGASFATGVRVVFGDGTFEWSSTLTGVDPYGP